MNFLKISFLFTSCTLLISSNVHCLTREDPYRIPALAACGNETTPAQFWAAWDSPITKTKVWVEDTCVTSAYAYSAACNPYITRIMNKAVDFASTEARYKELRALLEKIRTSPYTSIFWPAVATASATLKQKEDALGNTLAENTLIANLQSATTLENIYTTLDAALAVTTIINASALGSAVATALTRAIDSITTLNYAAVQAKLTTYITKATSKFPATNFSTIISYLTTKVTSVTPAPKPSIIPVTKTQLTNLKMDTISLKKLERLQKPQLASYLLKQKRPPT
jgi:hypothetical protein